MDEESLKNLESRLQLRFKDRTRFLQALTHRSAATESGLSSNERLEFLGDAVVGLVIGEYLYEKYPGYSEGSLAKSKSYIVSELSLADAAQMLGLDEFVRVSTGEASSGGRRRRSILADAFEALIAAIYLDSGIRSARRIVRAALKEAITASATEEHRRDYKSALQERTQARERLTPVYRIIREDGQDHDKTFQAQAVIGETVIGEGEGKSKKEAEQAAALDALDRYIPRQLYIPGE
jgi:ribonuclease-3